MECKILDSIRYLAFVIHLQPAHAQYSIGVVIDNARCTPVK